MPESFSSSSSSFVLGRLLSGTSEILHSALTLYRRQLLDHRPTTKNDDVDEDDLKHPWPPGPQNSYSFPGSGITAWTPGNSFAILELNQETAGGSPWTRMTIFGEIFRM